jgi:hypothetical protein
LWTTSAGLYVQIAGASVGPLGAGGGGGGLDQATADGRYVNIDGDTMTGALNINGTLNMTAAPGTSRSVVLQTNGSTRWTFGKNGTAEGGANSGSDFSLARYDDTGNWISDVISSGRSDGQTWFWGPPPALQTVAPTSGNHVTSKQYVDTDNTTRLKVSGGAMTGALNVPILGNGGNDVKLTDHINTQGKTIWGLPTPNNADWAAPKSYVDSRIVVGTTAPTDLTAIWIDTSP